MTEKKYRISGMHCAACSVGIEKFLSRQNGIEEVNVNLVNEIMTVKFNETVISSEEIIENVLKIQYGCVEYNPSTNAIDERKKHSEEIANNLKKQKKNTILALFFAIPLLYCSMGHMLGAPLPKALSMNDAPIAYSMIQFILTVPILICGRKFFTSGYPSLIHGRPNMDSLVALGTSAAFLYSIYALLSIIAGKTEMVHSICFESSSVVIAIIMLGKYLEERSKNQTSSAIEKLLALTPETARVTRYGETALISIEDLKKGDTIVVFAGERFPCDGIVIDGSSSVDLSMITGESSPIAVEIGSEVTGGSINLDGSLTITATKTGSDTTLSQIIRLVEDAQSRKAPIAKLADKVASWFVPAVLCIALISSAIWALTGKDFNFVLNIFVSVLVIACPCSLGLATPTAIMVGTGRAAELKILFKSGEAIERLSDVNTVILDKTGTVTQGKLNIVRIVPMNDYSEHDLISLSASAESSSLHPIALSIIEYANIHNIPYQNGCPSTVFPGKGVKSLVNSNEVLCGNASLLLDNGFSFNFSTEEDGTVIYTVSDGVLLGYIIANDTIKPDSAKAIKKLEQTGIRTVMVTGDNEQTAENISIQAGISEYYANVLPEEKARIISEIQKESQTVAMVGDGINDAPALAEADIGIAIGNGTDVAIESADIVLLGNDLDSINTAISLSKAVLLNIKENLFWAFFYNCCGIPFAAGVIYALGGPLLPPMFAGACMAISSITVVSNALRLKRFSKDNK